MYKTLWGTFFYEKKSDLRGPQGQIQGQSKDFKVIALKTTPTWKIMANFYCLCNKLSRDTNFNIFGPVVTEIW